MLTCTSDACGHVWMLVLLWMFRDSDLTCSLITAIVIVEDYLSRCMNFATSCIHTVYKIVSFANPSVRPL